LAADVDDRSAQAVRDVQIVFQNPAGALNPRHTVARILGRAVRRLTGLRGEAQRDRVTDLLDSVRLRPEQLTARPGQLSGGMKQRVAIARAFAGRPALVVCDEPTSALDVSVQAAILNLLSDLQERDRVSYLLISHDLAVVRYLADRVVVLYLGEVLEIGPIEEVFDGPRNPYTTTLLDAARSKTGAKPAAALGEEEAPTGDGCPFAPRCPHALPGVCAQTPPPLVQAGPDHVIRCHLPLEDLRRVARAAPVEQRVE
jgi:peptide/nickel transport system ATP-binding protein